MGPCGDFSHIKSIIFPHSYLLVLYPFSPTLSTTEIDSSYIVFRLYTVVLMVRERVRVLVMAHCSLSTPDFCPLCWTA